MLERLGGLLGLRPSTLSSLFVARLSSVSRNRDIDSNVSEAAEERNARRRLRYNSDAAHRERRLAQAKAWQAKDPDRTKLSARRHHNTRYKENPAFRQNALARVLRDYQEVWSKDPLYVQRKRLRNWFRNHADFMSALPWKTHHPQWHETPIEHSCQACNVKRHGGSRLWWQRLGSDDQYDCQSCYVKDVDASMPEGYEGITTWKAMVARKEELDALGQSNKSKP